MSTDWCLLASYFTPSALVCSGSDLTLTLITPPTTTTTTTTPTTPTTPTTTTESTAIKTKKDQAQVPAGAKSPQQPNPFPDIALFGYIYGLILINLLLLNLPFPRIIRGLYPTEGHDAWRFETTASALFLMLCGLDYYITCLANLPPKSPGPLPHAIWLGGHVLSGGWWIVQLIECAFRNGSPSFILSVHPSIRLGGGVLLIGFASLRFYQRLNGVRHVSDKTLVFACLLSLSVSMGNALSAALAPILWFTFARDVSWRVDPLPIPKRLPYLLFSLPHHRPHAVFARAVGLGLLGGAGVFVLFSPSIYSALGFFLFAVTLFHVGEYIPTALYHPQTVTLASFLLNHSPEYHAAITLSLVEYLLEAWLLPPPWKGTTLSPWRACAMGVVLAAQSLRTVAMITAGANFTHLVARDRVQGHRLVQHGVYAWLRHPAYTAFFWWGVMTQVVLLNPISGVGYALALWTFFADRVEEEEEALERFFGWEYVKYKAKTLILIPFL